MSDTKPKMLGYFDPNDIRERRAQLYNHTVFVINSSRVPNRYAEVPTDVFDKFDFDLTQLLDDFAARIEREAREDERNKISENQRTVRTTGGQ